MRFPLFACVFVALLIGEAIAVFAVRTIAFSIEGKTPYAIDAFGSGATIEHQFLMAGDGLNSVSVRLSAARPMTVRLLTAVSSAERTAPETRAQLYRWISVHTLESGDTWKRLDFPALPSSNDRLYTLLIRLIDGRVSDGGGSSTPVERLPVSLMASIDNPALGGVLWINGIRQAGSLYLRAHTLGETPYQRFRLAIEPRLPSVLRYRGLQVFVVVIYQWALLVFADALLFREVAGADA